jgi:hypothetical protein
LPPLDYGKRSLAYVAWLSSVAGISLYLFRRDAGPTLSTRATKRDAMSLVIASGACAIPINALTSFAVNSLLDANSSTICFVTAATLIPYDPTREQCG